MNHFIKTTLFLMAILLAPLNSTAREFTSSEGKKLQAEIVSATASEVTLKREKDGKDFTLPLTRLSEEDQKFVAEWLTKKKLNTRPARKLTLNLDGGKTETVDIPEEEYLTDKGTLTLYPGDTIHLEFDENMEKGGKPRIVTKVTNPKRTVTFTMSNKDGMTGLMRKTKMQLTVAMDCTHRGLGSNTFSRTNLRPTEKALMSFDSWPGTVWILRLSNFEVTSKSASEVYRERVSK